MPQYQLNRNKVLHSNFIFGQDKTNYFNKNKFIGQVNKINYQKKLGKQLLQSTEIKEKKKKKILNYFKKVMKKKKHYPKNIKMFKDKEIKLVKL